MPMFIGLPTLTSVLGFPLGELGGRRRHTLTPERRRVPTPPFGVAEEEPLLGTGVHDVVDDDASMSVDEQTGALPLDDGDAASSGCFGSIRGCLPSIFTSSRMPLKKRNDAKVREESWAACAYRATLEAGSAAMVGLRSALARGAMADDASATGSDDGTMVMSCAVCHAECSWVVECCECKVALCARCDRGSHSSLHQHQRYLKQSVPLRSAIGDSELASPPKALDAEEFAGEDGYVVTHAWWPHLALSDARHALDAARCPCRLMGAQALCFLPWRAVPRTPAAMWSESACRPLAFSRSRWSHVRDAVRLSRERTTARLT